MDVGRSNPAVTLAVYAALTYDIISATNSSPQTTEINAAARGDTLMKWVNIGLGQVVLFAALGVVVEHLRGNQIWPPLVGAGLAGAMLYAQYVYALQSGRNSTLPGTEHYG